jgi:hypothetical protein
MRTHQKNVMFTRPFFLSGFEHAQSPGTYTIETDEELIPGLSFAAYRTVATLILLPSRNVGATVVHQAAAIDPKELIAALESDGETTCQTNGRTDF